MGQELRGVAGLSWHPLRHCELEDAESGGLADVNEVFNPHFYNYSKEYFSVSLTTKCFPECRM
eukprot:10575381-Lingulodinium_polyedra.AAC.1